MKKVAFLIAPFLLFFSCKPAFTFVDTSCPGYRNVDFVRNDIKEKGLAVMPVLGGAEKEELRRPMGDALTTHLRDEFPNSTIVSPSQTISMINETGISGDYSEAIQNYSVSGIVPKELLQKIGNSLGVQYLLLTRFLSSSEYSAIYSGYGTTTIAVDEIYIQSQVWDVKMGDVVWEGKGGIAKLQNANLDVIESTATGLSKVIGNNKDEGPCGTRQQLTAEMQRASNNTIWAVTGGTILFTLIIMIPLL
jgi:hypothetical protein